MGSVAQLSNGGAELHHTHRSQLAKEMGLGQKHARKSK